MSAATLKSLLVGPSQRRVHQERCQRRPVSPCQYRDRHRRPGHPGRRRQGERTRDHCRRPPLHREAFERLARPHQIRRTPPACSQPTHHQEPAGHAGTRCPFRASFTPCPIMYATCFRAWPWRITSLITASSAPPSRRITAPSSPISPISCGPWRARLPHQQRYFGLKFLFRSSVPALPGKSFLAIPIKAELFPVLPSELERSKTDYLKTIVSVRPAGDGY